MFEEMFKIPRMQLIYVNYFTNLETSDFLMNPYTLPGCRDDVNEGIKKFPEILYTLNWIRGIQSE